MNEPLHFVALDENDFDIWTDGINALLSNTVSKIQPQLSGPLLINSLYFVALGVNDFNI